MGILSVKYQYGIPEAADFQVFLFLAVILLATAPELLLINEDVSEQRSRLKSKTSLRPVSSLSVSERFADPAFMQKQLCT